jgi:hypothetical protein
MSDTTSLSSNYSVTATFAKEFNSAVLILKRWYLAQGSVPPPAVEEAEVRRKLAEYLRGVISQLNTDEAGDGAPAEHIPEGIISRLVEKNQHKMSWFVTDLQQTEELLCGTTALGHDDFSVLDEVCDAADASASASFRRLWRR